MKSLMNPRNHRWRSLQGRSIFLFLKEPDRRGVKQWLEKMRGKVKVSTIQLYEKMHFFVSKQVPSQILGNPSKRQSRGYLSVKAVSEESREVDRVFSTAKRRNHRIKWLSLESAKKLITEYKDEKRKVEPHFYRFEFPIDDVRKRHPNACQYFITDGKGVHKIVPHILLEPPKLDINLPCDHVGSLFRGRQKVTGAVVNTRSKKLYLKTCDGCGGRYRNLQLHNKSKERMDWYNQTDFSEIDSFIDIFQSKSLSDEAKLTKVNLLFPMGPGLNKKVLMNENSSQIKSISQDKSVSELDKKEKTVHERQEAKSDKSQVPQFPLGHELKSSDVVPNDDDYKSKCYSKESTNSKIEHQEKIVQACLESKLEQAPPGGLKSQSNPMAHNDLGVDQRWEITENTKTTPNTKTSAKLEKIIGVDERKETFGACALKVIPKKFCEMESTEEIAVSYSGNKEVGCAGVSNSTDDRKFKVSVETNPVLSADSKYCKTPSRHETSVLRKPENEKSATSVKSKIFTPKSILENQINKGLQHLAIVSPEQNCKNTVYTQSRILSRKTTAIEQSLELSKSKHQLEEQENQQEFSRTFAYLLDQYGADEFNREAILDSASILESLPPNVITHEKKSPIFTQELYNIDKHKEARAQNDEMSKSVGRGKIELVSADYCTSDSSLSELDLVRAKRKLHLKRKSLAVNDLNEPVIKKKRILGSEHYQKVKPQSKSADKKSKKVLTCGACTSTFENPFSYKRHLASHTFIKPYKCDVCNKTFAQKNNLKTHMKIHADVKKFQCLTCEKRFVQKGNLISHLQVHAKSKAYKCPNCEKTYWVKKSFTKHLKSHSSERVIWVCHKGCTKTFVRKNDLKRHERIHMDVKNFECPVCKATFTTKPQRDVHTRVHTDKRPYECEACGKKFKQLGHLFKHTARHEKKRQSSKQNK